MSAPTDFADWLSPMLVKELRQGMRSRLFVILFLLLQAAMIFVAILGLSASVNRENTSEITVLFWAIIGIPLVFIIPMSGLNAIANERQANTLELVSLTRLTSRRILLGKWLSIVAQTIILACAILPYVVLRYFIGGVNLGTEFLAILVLVIASTILSGVAVGFSPKSSRLTRPLIAVPVFLVLQTILPRMVFGGLTRTFGVTTSLNWLGFLGIAWFAILLLLLMLEFGASKIAPLAENHSSSRRLIGLALVAGIAIFNPPDLLSSPLWTCSLILLAPICIGALCEPPSFIQSTYHPFLRFGAWGKLAGRFLYPGWPSGVLYCLMVLAGLFVVGCAEARADYGWRWIIWSATAVAGALFLPAAMTRVFLPRSPRPFVIYLGIQIILALMVILASALHETSAVDLRSSIAAIPLCGLLLSGSNAIENGNILGILIGSSAITAASIVALILKMIGPWREIQTLEKARSPVTPTLDAAEPATSH